MQPSQKRPADCDSVSETPPKNVCLGAAAASSSFAAACSSLAAACSDAATVASSPATPVAKAEAELDNAGFLGDCAKCMRPVLAGTEGSLGGSRSKQHAHRACVLAYKRRSKMNKKNKQLQQTWDGFSAEEKAQWYVKNTAEGLNEEAQDTVHHRVVAQEISAQETTVRNAAIPFHIFQERSEMRGWHAEKIRTEWSRMLLDPSIRKVKYNGEVMVCRMEGVFFDDRQSSQTSTGTSTVKRVASEAELQEANEQGRLAIQESRKAAKSFLAATATSSTAWATNHISIPDELMQNLGMVDDLTPNTDDIVQRIFQKTLSAQSRRQQMLDDLMREDLVEASIFLANNGGNTEKVETASDVQKYRVSKGNEFQKAKELFDLGSQSLATEAKDVRKAAMSKLGDGYEPAKESLTLLQTAKATLKTISSGYQGDVDTLKATFDEATTIDEMRETLGQLKSKKAYRMKEQGAIRKAVSMLKALIKKQETADLKGVRDVDEGSTEAGGDSPDTAKLAQHFVNYMFPTHGKAINLVKGRDNFSRLKAVYIAHDSLKTLTSSIKFAPTLISWLQTELKGKETGSAALDKPKYVELIQQAVADALPPKAFAKPYSVLHDVLTSAFAISLQICTHKYSSHGFLPYGLGSWFLMLEGALLVVGVMSSALNGHSFGDKREDLVTAPPARVEQLVQQHGFAAHLEVGSGCWVPPGFVTLIVSLGSSALFRWSSMSPEPAPECPEMRAVLSSTTQMVSSYPVLAGNYQPWMRFLEVLSRSTT